MDDNRLRLPGKTEFSFFTERSAATGLGDETADENKYNPQAHYEVIRQWVTGTRPRKKSFDRSSASAENEPFTWTSAIDADSLFEARSQISATAAAAAELLQDEWQKKEFDRAFASIRRRYEPRQPDEAFEARRILEKVKRYRRAFLKGFFEARIRRIEANKWVYEKLHVKPECVKGKYRKLMCNSEPRFNPVDLDKPFDHPVENASPGENRYENKLKINDDSDLESVFSFVPERDNVLLQDENAPPHERGFGSDQRAKYDSSIKLLDLDDWLPPDIQHFLDEKRLQEIRQMEEAQQQENIARDEDVKVKAPKNIDRKYEEIPGMNVDLPRWMGPKKLDEQELERERNVPGSHAGEPLSEEQPVAKDLEVFPKIGKEELASELLAESKDDYKLWYSTHDMFNTTPFLEARLQRLLREVIGKRDWELFRSYVRDGPSRSEENKDDL